MSRLAVVPPRRHARWHAGSEPATEVHHLTYQHVGHEFLFELVAICRECHTRWHGGHTMMQLDECRPTLLATALDLARQGYAVFPCVNRPKDPDTDKTPLAQHGFKDASRDPKMIARWWRRWPDALIGVPAGINFVALDLDLQHADAQRWYEHNRSRLPLTRMHVTRSGGSHLLFKPIADVGCSTSRLGPHIDTRGLGGYIIWWPACGLDVLHGGVLAPVPEWIIEELHPPSPPSQGASSSVCLSHEQAHRKLAGILRTIARAHQGERNSLTFWGACRLAEMVAGGMLSQADALAIAIEAASRTGLSYTEARRTAQSAFREIE